MGTCPSPCFCSSCVHTQTCDCWAPWSSACNFLRRGRTVSHGGCTVLRPRRQRTRVPASPRPRRRFFILLIIAVPAGVQWPLTSFKGRSTRTVRFLGGHIPGAYGISFYLKEESSLRAECPGTSGAAEGTWGNPGPKPLHLHFLNERVWCSSVFCRSRVFALEFFKSFCAHTHLSPSPWRNSRVSPPFSGRGHSGTGE